MRITRSSGVLVWITAGQLLAFDPNLVFDGQYRGRMDIYNGVNKSAYGNASIDSKGNSRGEPDDSIYLQQIIAGVNYSPSALWEYKLYMYDSRSWGSSLGTQDFLVNKGTSDEYTMDYYNDHFELYTTYARRKNLFDTPLTLTLGRQKLGYGDRRVFGPGEWGNTMGWLWDALHLSYKQDKNFLDIWYGQTRTKAPDDFSVLEKHRYQGIGVYGHYETDPIVIEPLFAWKNPLYHTTLPYENFYYAGSRFYKEGLGWNTDITAVKEFGYSGNKTVNAYGYVVKAGYQWDAPSHPKLTAGYTYASGDKNSNDLEVGTFTTPFGMNDGPYYGRADIVIWSNIKDIETALNVNVLPNLNGEIGFHRFSLADAQDKWYEFGYKNKSGNSYTHIGDEVDVSLNYRVGNTLTLLGIVSYFKPGDFIRKNDIGQSDASKIFLQVEYRFSTKEKK